MASFLDLLILDEMGPDTTMNSFCTEIGSSFFETASYFGSMQMKGLVRIEAGVGRSIVNKTDVGEKFLQRAKAMVEEPLDELDHAIIRAIAGGAKSPEEVGAKLNVFEDDIALHLWRLVQQGYIKTSVANVKVTLSLTDSGFKLAGAPLGRARIAPPSPAPEPGQTKLPLEPVEPVLPEIGPSTTLEEQMKEAIVRGPDITATPALGEIGEIGSREEEVELTPLYIFRAKLAHYLGRFWPILAVIAAAVIVVLALRALGYV